MIARDKPVARDGAVPEMVETGRENRKITL
jgi:hypothetical protein